MRWFRICFWITLLCFVTEIIEPSGAFVRVGPSVTSANCVYHANLERPICNTPPTCCLHWVQWHGLNRQVTQGEMIEHCATPIIALIYSAPLRLNFPVPDFQPTFHMSPHLQINFRPPIESFSLT
jgi:hypothetical protein